jgi:hypothetical protein
LEETGLWSSVTIDWKITKNPKGARGDAVVALGKGGPVKCAEWSALGFSLPFAFSVPP